jgi:uncharacterized protein (DUF362 family)
MSEPRVILRRCETADPATIRAIIAECFSELKFQPRGRALIKPNIVTANRQYIHHSHTHPAVTEAIAHHLKTRPEVTQITIGESSGFGIPPGLFAHEAGYDALARRLKVRLVDFNEDRATWVDLKKAVAQKGFHVPRSILEADTKIWVPKLKYHICCEVTNSLKLNIGILQHRDRMAVHDNRLNDKIVDMLEIGYPDCVVTDAIHIGHGFESAPQGFHPGLLLVSNNPLAADAVAGAALCYKPEEIVHLRIARDRGYGSIDLNDIHISGDYPLDEIASKTKGLVSEYQDILAVDTPIKFYCGDAPDHGPENAPSPDCSPSVRRESESANFCYGGCLAAVKGCLGTIDKRRPGSVSRSRPGAVVTGIYKGDVIHPGQTAFLIGDCSRVDGTLEAKRVIRLSGCPIGASKLLIKMPSVFKMPSPMSDARSAAQFIYFTIRHALRKLLLKIIPG